MISNASSAFSLISKVACCGALAAGLAASTAHAEDKRSSTESLLSPDSPTIPGSDIPALQYDPCDDVYALLDDNDLVSAQVAVVADPAISGMTPPQLVSKDVFGRYQVLSEFARVDGDIDAGGTLDLRFKRSYNSKASRYDYAVTMTSCRNPQDCKAPHEFVGTPIECSVTGNDGTILLRDDSVEETIVVRFDVITDIGG